METPALAQLANALAYETAVQMAAKYHWTAVLNLMMQDGFQPKQDYVGLLELWQLDSELED